MLVLNRCAVFLWVGDCACGDTAPRGVVGELPDSAHTHLSVCPIHRQVGCAKPTDFLGMGKTGWHAAVAVEWKSERPKKKIPTQD